jgi:hypothetical protein
MIRTLGRQLTELSFRSQLLPSRLHTPGRRFFRIMNFQSAQTRRLCRPLFRHVCRQCVLDLIHLTNVRVSRPYYSLSQACLPHHYGLSSERLCFWQDWFSIEAMRCSFPGSPHLSSMSPEITCSAQSSTVIDCAVTACVNIHPPSHGCGVHYNAHAHSITPPFDVRR